MSSRARSQHLAHRQRLPLHAAGCVEARLSLLPIPTTATSGPNTSPPLSCFLVWVRGYCPFFSFWGTMHPHWTSFFEFWLQGDYGLTLPITTTAGAEGAWAFATLTKYLATNVESPQNQWHTATRSTFLSLGQGLLPIFEFWGPLHPIEPPFFNFGPGGFAHGRTKRHLFLLPSY